MKTWKIVWATLFFAGVMLSIYYIHIARFKVDVLLYSAIFDVLLAVSLTFAGLQLTGYFESFTGLERTLLAVVWALAGYSLAISVPTVIDRSLSFYILEKLQQRGGAIQLARFEEVFTHEYVKEHRLVAVRLTEQERSGTITISDGCVRLTPRGRSVTSFSRWFREHLLPRKRLLMGAYSDALVDPFRDSIPAPDYACR